MPFSEALKRRVKKKAHFTCCVCYDLGEAVHHILPEENGGPSTEENAVLLCAGCHGKYGANPEKEEDHTGKKRLVVRDV